MLNWYCVLLYTVSRLEINHHVLGSKIKKPDEVKRRILDRSDYCDTTVQKTLPRKTLYCDLLLFFNCVKKNGQEKSLGLFRNLWILHEILWGYSSCPSALLPKIINPNYSDEIEEGQLALLVADLEPGFTVSANLCGCRSNIWAVLNKYCISKFYAVS